MFLSKTFLFLYIIKRTSMSNQYDRRFNRSCDRTKRNPLFRVISRKSYVMHASKRCSSFIYLLIRVVCKTSYIILHSCVHARQWHEVT